MVLRTDHSRRIVLVLNCDLWRHKDKYESNQQTYNHGSHGAEKYQLIIAYALHSPSYKWGHLVLLGCVQQLTRQLTPCHPSRLSGNCEAVILARRLSLGEFDI